MNYRLNHAFMRFVNLCVKEEAREAIIRYAEEQIKGNLYPFFRIDPANIKWGAYELPHECVFKVQDMREQHLEDGKWYKTSEVDLEELCKDDLNQERFVICSAAKSHPFMTDEGREGRIEVFTIKDYAYFSKGNAEVPYSTRNVKDLYNWILLVEEKEDEE